MESVERVMESEVENEMKSGEGSEESDVERVMWRE